MFTVLTLTFPTLSLQQHLFISKEGHCCFTSSLQKDKTKTNRLTSSGRQHVNKLLGVPDIEGGHWHETIWLPNFDLIGEADKVKVIAGPQVPQDGEEGIFSLGDGK